MLRAHDRDRHDHRDRRNVVVVTPRPTYRPQAEVRYYSDSRGRYFVRGGRRTYCDEGVNYRD